LIFGEIQNPLLRVEVKNPLYKKRKNKGDNMSMIRLKTMENGIAKKMATLDIDVANGTKEKLVHSLYHIKKISGKADGSVALPTELNYFSIKTGANDDDGTPTTYADINMDSAGMISQGYYFWGQDIRVVALPDKSDETPFIKAIDKANLNKFFVNDIGKILCDGVLSIEVADKPLVRLAPLISFPSMVGIDVPSIVGDTTFVNANFKVSGEANRPIDLWLENNITFKFKVNFFGTPKKVYQDFRLGFFIDGILYRPRA